MKTSLLLMAMFLSTAVTTGTWTLVRGGTWSPNQLSEVQTATRQAFELNSRAYKAQHGIGTPPWNAYTFQYQGNTRNGERLIFVNAFCKMHRDNPDLSREFLLVHDGGACYFRAVYDPTHKHSVELNFNGIGG
jgi:hypothetical protein